MYLASVPLVEDTSSGVTIVRPDLPPQVLTKYRGWGQASNCLHAQKKTILWLAVTEAEADLVSAWPGCKVYNQHTPRETADLEDGMQRGSKRAIKEFTIAYRTLTTALEDAERRRAWLEKNMPAILKVGGQALLLFLLSQINPAMALAAALATDNCDGTSGTSFHGRSTTTGSKTWATFLGFDWLQIGSGGSANSAYSTNVGIGWLSDMSDTADSYVQCVAKTNNAGPYTRIGTSGNTSGYWVRHNNTNVDMYYAVPGSAYVQLGSNGSAPGTNPVLKVSCSGSSVSGYKNGTLDVGPVTDTNRSTGRAGIFILESGKYLDDWEYGTDVVPGGQVIRRRATMRALLGR